jgi:hypothetical protein
MASPAMRLPTAGRRIPFPGEHHPGMRDPTRLTWRFFLWTVLWYVTAGLPKTIM